MKKIVIILLVLSILMSGCSSISKEAYDTLKEQNNELTSQVDELNSQVDKLNAENEQLKAQIKTQNELHMSKVFDLNDKNGKSLIKTISVQQESLKINNVIVIELEQSVVDISFKINYINLKGEVIGSTDVVYSKTLFTSKRSSYQFTCACELSKLELIDTIKIQWINAG